MRGGKDEEKVRSPMFPRLHVNDTEKGGPKAPPRNKMALYEQLSIPSQRFTSSGSASMLPLPNSTSSHIGGHQGSMFPAFCRSPAPSHQALPSNLTCSSFEENNYSILQNFSVDNKIGDEAELSVSTSSQGITTPPCRNGKHNKERGLSRLVFGSLTDSKEQTSGRAQSMDLLESRFNVRNPAEEKRKSSQTSQDPVKRPSSTPSAKDKTFLVASSSPYITKTKNSDGTKQSHASMGQENRSILVHNTSKRLFGSNEQLAVQDSTAFRDNDKSGPEQDIGSENASIARSMSRSRPLPRDDTRKRLDIIGSQPKRKKCGYGDSRDQHVDRLNVISDASIMVDSVSAVDISPDVVVGVIGEKQFWKARKAIANQQRIFAVQVFELHRLIKVQKLIAGSPHILLEDNLYLGKPPLEVIAATKLPTHCALEAPPSVTLEKKCHNPNHSTPIGKLPIPTLDNSIREGSLNGNEPRNMPPSRMDTHTKSKPWSFNPLPANQWLVPIMTPSEGLVYKPYTGPCPPNGGFVAPIYGTCDAAYGIQASPQQEIGTPLNHQAYFPPFGLPVINQSLSSSVEQRSPNAKPRSNGLDHELQVGDHNYTTPHQTSRYMSSLMSRVMSRPVRKFQGSKGSELQGSTASSLSEKADENLLPLFPVASTTQESNQSGRTGEHRTRLIKVVPHNSRSATESAARIFQLIQQEKKQM